MNQQEDTFSKDNIVSATSEELNLEVTKKDDDASSIASCYEAGSSEESSPQSSRESFVCMPLDGPSCSRSNLQADTSFERPVKRRKLQSLLQNDSSSSSYSDVSGNMIDTSNSIDEDVTNQDDSHLISSNSMMHNDDASFYVIPETLPQNIFSSPSIHSKGISSPKVSSSTNLFGENVNQAVLDNTASTSWYNSDSEAFDPSAFHNEPQPSTSSLEVSESAMPGNIQINADELSNNCIPTSSNDQSLGENLASSSLDHPTSSSWELPASSSHDNSSVPSVEGSGEPLLTHPQIGDKDETINNDSSDIFNRPNNIRATRKEIGFLGIGEMGNVLVKNLLKSGHIITVWNRTPEKYRDFLMDGAEEAKFPCDVIKKCDIIFCCLSDEIAVKKVVEGKNGVLEGFKECKDNKTGKGFVQLTTLDSLISLNHSESISKLGGKYLEAVMMGTKELAQNLAMMYICAGHVGLFNDCYTCFASTSREALFLGEKVGKAGQMKIVVSMVKAAQNATIQEAIGLITRKKMSLDPLKAFLLKGPLKCPVITKRTIDLLENKPDTEFKTRQRDLHLATLSNQSFPLPMAAAVKQSDLYNNAIKKKRNAGKNKK